MIKPNNHELGEIFGKELNRDEEITQAARKLQQRGARNVLVSMAGDGALLLDETGAVHRIGTPKGKVVNSVGAGDSMVAGFIAGYLPKRELLLRPAPWHRLRQRNGIQPGPCRAPRY